MRAGQTEGVIQGCTVIGLTGQCTYNNKAKQRVLHDCEWCENYINI